MASRHVGLQQNRAEAAGAGKQKKMAAGGEVKNRRALGDIGNLVTVRGIDGKKLPQVSRPVTRSFCAQLVANAQAAAVEKNKKQRAIVGDGALEVKPRAALNQRKVSVKPKTEDLTVISPDTEEEVKKVDKQLNKKKAVEGSLKKKGQTFTSTLTARSKAACGLTKKPKAQIVDIDAADANNELAAVEYVEDMYKFYKLVENETRVYDYIHSQPEINEKMRAILVDWLIEASLPNDPAVENMTYFLAELGIMNYATVMYCPSMIAASAVYGARCTLNKAPFWNDTLALHSGFSEAQLMECAKALVRLHSSCASGGDKLKAIYKKYSNAERGAVSLLSPAKTLLTVAAAAPHSVIRDEKLDGIVMFTDDSNMHSMELFDEIQTVKGIRDVSVGILAHGGDSDEELNVVQKTVGNNESRLPIQGPACNTSEQLPGWHTFDSLSYARKSAKFIGDKAVDVNQPNLTMKFN
ncbi:Cyclin N-terminal domain-containing protein [Heracleum sosnowskyi]|uniref:Glycosyltransferases n=1 Tax=Heracleum sosnowskyi TaxID=360622 RepID=A0AAD8IWW7_9APIA|nr:Cyclin N-terminal domain-containing protein [Heracleum sosnowskyi]